MSELTIRAIAGVAIKRLAGLTTIRGHTFMDRTIGRDSIVLDLGCNAGAFARDIQRLYGCVPIAVEANPALAYALREQGLRVHNLAICDHDGEIELMVSGNLEASSVFLSIAKSGSVTSREVVAASTLRTFISDNKIASIALAKVDIEGAELSLIEQLTEDDLLPQQLAVEFHDFIDSSHGPRVRSCISHMKALGYVYVNSTFPDHSDCLFVHASMFKGWSGAWIRTRLYMIDNCFRIRSAIKANLRKTNTKCAAP